MRWLLISCLSLLLDASSDATFEVGTIASSVIALTKDNFRQAVEDPANPKWFLKFYAPWCGHCKQLAPVLEKVAPHLAGKLSFGTIDCTTHKALCDEFNVRGYPTLKFSLDGEIHDYPGGRKADEIFEFSDRLNRPVIEKAATVAEALDATAERSDEGVAFVVYHPDTEGSTFDDRVQSTLLTQVFAQVARKLRARGLFLFLDTDAADAQDLHADKKPMICRIEASVPPRCFHEEQNKKNINLETVLSYVKEQQMPTIAHLGPHNFHRIGRSGRPLAIAVVDVNDKEQVSQAKGALKSYALEGKAEIRDGYYYGWFDGKQWSRFLEQFDVLEKDLPQVFVLDVPARTYWQNSTYKLNIEEFLDAVQDGTIESKSAAAKGWKGSLEKALNLIIQYQPWSFAVIVLFVICFSVIVAYLVSPGDDFHPPYPPEQQQRQRVQQKPKPGSTESSSEGTQEDTKKVR